jgi:predicted NBD/HSP70 family sugar kinase/predicted transcriptional regulator
MNGFRNGLSGNANSTYRNNRQLVYDILRKQGSLSKTEIGKRTGMTSMTAGNIIRDLSEMGFIQSVGTESTGGRKALLYALESHSWSIAVDLSSDEILIALIDIKGSIRELRRYHTDGQDGTRMLQLIHALSDFLGSKGSVRDKVVGIGVAIPGLVDDETGIAQMSLPLKWENVPVRSVLEQAFSYPIIIGKETHAAIAGEYYFGAADSENSLYVNLGAGIGVGIMINGQIHDGASKMAGELGHIIVEPDGPLCECGNRGCLERVASLRALLQQAREAAQSGTSSMLAQIYAEKGHLNIGDLVVAVEGGDVVAGEIMGRGAKNLALAIITLKRLFDPPLIVIGGNELEEEKFYCKEVTRYVKEFSGRLDGGTAITFSKLGEKARLLGASTWVFDSLLQHRLTANDD